MEKTKVICLNWVAIKELSATGKTAKCAVCGGAKSAKAMVCKDCVCDYCETVKTVKEAVSAHKTSITNLEKGEWRQIQRECVAIEVRGARGDAELKEAISAMYPRFSPELNDSIIVGYRNWQECCRIVRQNFNINKCRRNLSWYAGKLQEIFPALAKFTHGMVLGAVNEVYQRERSRLSRVAAMLVDRHAKYIISLARAGQNSGEINRLLHMNSGVFGFEDGEKRKIMTYAIGEKIARMWAADEVIKNLNQRVTWVSCPNQFSHPKQALRLSQTEMNNNEVILRLKPQTLVIDKDLGINMSLFEKSSKGLVFIGRCNPVLRDERLTESRQETQPLSGKMR